MGGGNTHIQFIGTVKQTCTQVKNKFILITGRNGNITDRGSCRGDEGMIHSGFQFAVYRNYR